MTLKDKDVTLTVKPYRAKRTLSANAYYWKLLGELAKVLKVSNPYLHNQLLRRYGVVNGDMFVNIPDTDEAARKTDESETYHLKPTSAVQGDFRIYLMLKGSRDMNKEEFSRLLNGLIDECKECGIETMTPDEIARLKYDAEHYAV